METYFCWFYYYSKLSVLILPMRNGNYKCIQKDLCINQKFLSYLWGMETFPPHICSEYSCLSFLSYLWGMETKDLRLRILTIFMFLSYLWGMETFCCSVIGKSGSSSYPTYEEWKQFTSERAACVSSLFLSNLWGMETQ